MLRDDLPTLAAISRTGLKLHARVIGMLYRKLDLVRDEHVLALRYPIERYETMFQQTYIGRAYPLQYVKRLILRRPLDSFLGTDKCRSVTGQVMVVNAFESGRHHSMFPHLDRIVFTNEIATTINTIRKLHVIDLLSVLARPYEMKLGMSRFGHDIHFPYEAFRTPFADRLAEITIYIKEPPTTSLLTLIRATAPCPSLLRVRFTGPHFNTARVLTRVSQLIDGRDPSIRHILHSHQTIQYLMHCTWDRQFLTDKRNDAIIEIHLPGSTLNRKFLHLRSAWYRRATGALRLHNEKYYFRLHPTVRPLLPQATVLAYERLRSEPLESFGLPIKFVGKRDSGPEGDRRPVV